MPVLQVGVFQGIGSILRCQLISSVLFQIPEMVENFMFQNTEQPAFFRRPPLEGVFGLQGGKQGHLDDFLGGVGVLHPDQSIAVQHVSVLFHP